MKVYYNPETGERRPLGKDAPDEGWVVIDPVAEMGGEPEPAKAKPASKRRRSSKKK